MVSGGKNHCRGPFYLSVVFMVAGAVLIFITLAILPQFKELFEDMRSQLPVPTRILLNHSYAFVALGCCLILVGAGICAHTLKNKQVATLAPHPGGEGAAEIHQRYAIISSLMIVFLGIIVGFMVLALFLPLFNISQVTS